MVSRHNIESQYRTTFRFRKLFGGTRPTDNRAAIGRVENHPKFFDTMEGDPLVFYVYN